MPSKFDLLLEKKRYGLPQTISVFEKIKLFFGMPVQKIIGYIEMSDVKISIKKKVLIPRYETEELVQHAKKLITENKYTNILDMCSGSGYIGIAIKNWNPKLKVVCVDIDRKSISQSKINAKINKVEIDIIKSNLFDKIQGKFDLIISNPPYISKKSKNEINKSVLLFEPKIALFAPDDGMFFYKEIEKKAGKYIKKNGALLFEINQINEKYFLNRGYKNYKDINRKTRFSILKY
ncbi:MAG: peptide chain release factor N(5)-glutamine methyltransferase [Mycoplasmataceae bacterium]|nr:peptide chain release factor N(5)-glutamine methyltransferase [Mycoplasmataceae bacterium]